MAPYPDSAKATVIMEGCYCNDQVKHISFLAIYLLCDNVTAMTFTKDTATEEAVTYVKSVQISMTVVSGDVEKTISAAAVVRRNLK